MGTTVFPHKGRPLRRASLSQLPGSVTVPSYDVHELTPAVVHLGVGAFHRAHQAVYLDRLAEAGERGWGLVGGGLRSSRMTESLTPQEGLYTVIERGDDPAPPHVVGVLQRYVYARDHAESLLQVLADARTRMVSLTITAPAYDVEPGPRVTSGAFDYLVEALARRRSAGLAGFTVVSCDNLPNNGAAAREATLRTAELRDPRLARWITEHVTFPTSMVDRITPPAGLGLRRELRQRHGVHDRCPVATETFSQWVLEDSFSNGRPPLDDVGVELVTDAQPFSRAKTRLLNGSHCAIGYLGSALGHTTSAEAMRDPLVARLVVSLMAQEVAPLLTSTRGLDLAAYQRTLLARFRDDAVADPLSRLCARGSVRMPNYVLPSLEEALLLGRQHRHLLLVLAAWIHHLRSHQGSAETLNDPRGEALRSLARQGGDDPRPLLSVTSVFGSLGSSEELVRELRGVLRALRLWGMAAVLDSATAPSRTVLREPTTASSDRRASETPDGESRAASS